MATKKYILLSFLLGCLFSCEDLYQPDIEKMDDLVVIEARLVYGQAVNSVRIYKTISFGNVKKQYPAVKGAKVSLSDDKGNNLLLQEGADGTYTLKQPLNRDRKYKLRVEAGGDTYSSSFQGVPALPDIDSVYVEPAEQLLVGSTDESSGKLQKIAGSQVYVNIKGEGGKSYCRFKGRKICQYAYNKIESPANPVEIPVYAWLSLAPVEIFNIAAPAEYSLSDDIVKHPLVFLDRSYTVFIPDIPTFFSGWIYICHQYAISKETYQFYKDLNRQLSAGGKIFDPLYTQSKGNITCISNSDKIALGNFEIATVKEHRFYVEWLNEDNYFIRRIPYFWDIPPEGNVEEMPPVWWEKRNKEYPVAKSGQMNDWSMIAQ